MSLRGLAPQRALNQKWSFWVPVQLVLVFSSAVSRLGINPRMVAVVFSLGTARLLQTINLAFVYSRLLKATKRSYSKLSFMEQSIGVKELKEDSFLNSKR